MAGLSISPPRVGGSGVTCPENSVSIELSRSIPIDVDPAVGVALAEEPERRSDGGVMIIRGMAGGATRVLVDDAFGDTLDTTVDSVRREAAWDAELCLGEGEELALVLGFTFDGEGRMER